MYREAKNTFNQLKLVLIGLFISVNLSNLAIGEPQPWSDNVCNIAIPIKKDIIVEQPVEYEIKVQSMCGLLPCVKTRTEQRTDQSIKTVLQYINKTTCCPGYTEIRNGRCSPICSDPCGPSGKCVAPDICKCYPEPTQSAPGYTGPTCRRFACLANNRWGASCDKDCQFECTTNSYCNAETGLCLCNPGWHGPNCSLECDPDDPISSGCNFISQMPPIVDPDANLLSTKNNLILSRAQKAEALVSAEKIDEDVRIVSNTDSNNAWASLASSYMLGFMSVLSFILLVAFIVVKKRYDSVRNELYYASVGGSNIGGSSISGSPGSNYSASTYYTAPLSKSPEIEKNQENLSFAAATRNILSGTISHQSYSKKAPISPKTEAHLIRSQKASQQNIYSGIDPINRSRAHTPVIANDDLYDHIYQVPKKCNNTPLESCVKPDEHSVNIGEDNDSNIYEELKPFSAIESDKQ